MGRLQADAVPTVRQFTVLAALVTAAQPRTAKDMHVRADVLWRMEEAGWVARTAWNGWYIKDAGQAALERWRNRNIEVATRTADPEAERMARAERADTEG